MESFQFFGFRDIAPLNLSRIIWTYHPRSGGCEPRLGPSFRCHFIFRKYDNLPVQSGTIGEYNRESDTVQMIATHRGNVTADEMLQARFWIAAPALLKYKCASFDCTRQTSPLTGPFNDPDWLFELKHDGFRSLAYVEDGKCRLVSRRRNQYKSFEVLRSALEGLGARNAILDGEIVCLDSSGVSQFKRAFVTAI
jgi:hypothetical protein